LCDDSGSVNFSSSLGDLNLNGELEVSWCLDKSFLELAKFVELLLEGVSEVAASLGVSSSWSSGLSDSSSDISRSQDSLDQTASASISDDLLLEDSSWLLLVNLLDNLVSLEDLLDVSLSSLDDLGSVDLLSDDLSLWLGSLSNLLLEDSNLLVDLLDGLLGSDSLSNDLSDWGSLVDLLDELLSDDLSLLVDDVDVSDNLLGLGDLLLGSDLLSWLSLDDFLVSVDLVPLLLDSFLHEWPTTLDDLSFDDLFPDVLSSWLGGLLISLLENLDDLFLLSDELRFENLSWSVGKNSLVASSCSSLSS